MGADTSWARVTIARAPQGKRVSVCFGSIRNVGVRRSLKAAVGIAFATGSIVKSATSGCARFRTWAQAHLAWRGFAS